MKIIIFFFKDCQKSTNPAHSAFAPFPPPALPRCHKLPNEHLHYFTPSCPILLFCVSCSSVRSFPVAHPLYHILAAPPFPNQPDEHISAGWWWISSIIFLLPHCSSWGARTQGGTWTDGKFFEKLLFFSDRRHLCVHSNCGKGFLDWPRMLLIASGCPEQGFWLPQPTVTADRGKATKKAKRQNIVVSFDFGCCVFWVFWLLYLLSLFILIVVSF